MKTIIYYDITTEERAQKTVEAITGIPFASWQIEYNPYNSNKEDIRSIIDRYNGRIIPYSDYIFVFEHLTSSSDGCNSIFENGIQDLPNAYSNRNSELRRFLDSHGIIIDLENETLSYQDKIYDISFNPSQMWNGPAKSIGYRFFQDYCVCGFLSINRDRPYATRVDQKPEILVDIGNLINMAIDDEWMFCHNRYKITATVNSRYINIYNECDEKDSLDDISLHYTEIALDNCFKTEEKILLCKKGFQVPANNICSIKPFNIW